MSTVMASTLERAVDRGWRIFGTGLSFVAFGVGGALLSFTVFPLIRLTSSRETAGRRIRRVLQRAFRLHLWLMNTLGLNSFEVRGGEWLSRPGQLVVANHPTLIDVVHLMALIPNAGCVVKRSLWRNPFLRWPVVWAGYIPNSSDSETLVHACAALLRSGRTLIVFPEGTRTPPGQPMRLKRGAAQIALAAGADVLPVSIVCQPLTLTKDEPWYRVPPVPAHFTITVFPPVSATAYQQQNESNSIAARHLTDFMAAQFARGAERAMRAQLPATAAVTP
jgi:1-acyl-sn-glycerol-3-phosphate acyltransferase